MIFNMMDGAGGGKATVTYTGTHTTESYTLGGKAYTLYKITGSGTLMVKGKAKGVGIWLCGGGANGDKGGYGGAGAYCAQIDDAKLKGNYVVTVGAAQGATSFGELLTTAAVSGRNGGTGGGGAGTGDGKSKYPFGDTAAFAPHCAGGGSGAGERCVGQDGDYNWSVWPITGYRGGTNGGNGANTGSSSSGGAGGNRGGGNGGYKARGSNATFYGSGAGGGGVDWDPYGSQGYTNTEFSGGAGYQGIVYLCVPA